MLSRRQIIKSGAAALPAAALFPARSAVADPAAVSRPGGEDYCHLSGAKRKAIPTACGQCAARCATIGYVQQGRVVKLEGHPGSTRTRGKLCARGQASVNQMYDPDRILHPLKRAGRRGEGKWQRIGWDAALADLAGRLARLREEGRPERLLFHHGWISASARTLVGRFLDAYGTGSVIDQPGLGQSAKRTALELTWGGPEDSWDLENARFVLNLGSNCLEAGTNHLALAIRLSEALADQRLRLVTVDVRLSNTAARSQEWLPIKPGTDVALQLALSHVVMRDGLYRGKGEEFLRFCKVTADTDASVAAKVAALERHLAPYTPVWAEGVTGIAAATIEMLAVQFATTRPACVISARGAFTHENGVETERAIQMLAAITGNIDAPGTRCRAAAPEWRLPPEETERTGARDRRVLAGLDGETIVPGRGYGHQALQAIAEGGAEPPGIYMWYGCNPVYANGEVAQGSKVLEDESLIPYAVCISPFYDESAALADLILPDATFMERWDCEDGHSPDQLTEFYIRQPLVAPRGEARDFKDVCCDLAARLGIPLGFATGKEFVVAACESTPAVRDNGGFEEIAKTGLLRPASAVPSYGSYRATVAADEIQRTGVLFDAATGVYWDWTKSGAANEDGARRVGYTGTPGAATGYIGQRFGDTVHAGFGPHALNKSGAFELYSSIAEAHGLGVLPRYRPISGHAAKAAEELVLTTYKVCVQTLSRSQNCKWLGELYHDNPAWMNPADAALRGIGDGDRIRIGSSVGKIETTAKVTNLVTPGVIAVSAHCGRWEYGRYASGRKAPTAAGTAPEDDFKWWSLSGTHPNWVIPSSTEPQSGQQRWMDTVVTVLRV